jgi:hypothetical protein
MKAPTAAWLLASLAALAGAAPPDAAPASGAAAANPAENVPAWTVVGRQGLVQLVIVPQAQLRDEAAYRAQIARICPPQATCFVNFYGNSQGVAPAVPLPAAIADEATATFRRSAKQMAESFRWACRLQVAAASCF